METKHCQECGLEMNLIPAGVSKKTGKPYKAFLACPNKCKTNWNDTKPSRSQFGNDKPVFDAKLEVLQMILQELRVLNLNLTKEEKREQPFPT